MFTDSAKKDGRFFVLDVETNTTFFTSPKNVAVEKDFNRIDVEGYPPDFIENAFSPLEQAAADAIATTVKEGKFPSDENYSSILHLIGLIAVRNPFFRQSFNAAREHSARVVADLLVSDEKIWKNYIEKARREGEVISKDITFQEFKEFVDSGAYDVEFHPQGNLRVELKTFEKMLPILHERWWSLITTPPEGPEFICSDHPLTLYYKNSKSGPIGLGTRETELFFPLTNRAGFYGTFEEPLKEVVTARPKNVAIMNSRIAFNARRQLYSRTNSFLVWKNGEIWQKELHI